MESKDKLSALKNDFDVWRSKREKGTPVPNALKERACQLLEHCKISHIARSCNVSATLVRTWKKILNQDDPKNNPKSVTFMELSNPKKSEQTSLGNHLHLELTKQNGVNMQLSGPISEQTLNIIIKSFVD